MTTIDVTEERDRTSYPGPGWIIRRIVPKQFYWLSSLIQPPYDWTIIRVEAFCFANRKEAEDKAAWLMRINPITLGDSLVVEMS